MTKIAVTGATGFIGSNFVTEVLSKTDWEVVSIERLGHAKRDGVKTLHHDLLSEFPEPLIKQLQGTNYIVHFAGDVSGLASLSHPELTVTTNVVGTFNVLELARKIGALEKFIFISTGEVVGQTPNSEVRAEDAALHPSNPYSASKAAGEALVNAYRVSFGVPASIVRIMNVFGPAQSTARFVPMVLKQMFENTTVKCHVDSFGKPGSRNWLHVDHVSRVLLQIIKQYRTDTYHVVGPHRNNLEIIEVLAKALNLTPAIDKVLPGPSHDHRYALVDTKLGTNFEDVLERDLISVAHWYNKHRDALQ